MINTIISAVLQLLFFTLPGFLFYVIKNRRVRGFLPWIGLKKEPIKISIKEGVAYYTVITLFMGANLIIQYLTLNNKSRFSMCFDDLTPEIAVLSIFITTLINNGLSEEILFRGFIGKRLIKLLGYKWGNILQSCIFTLVHLPNLIAYGPLIGVVSTIMVFGCGYLFGRIVTKNMKGSILLVVAIHFFINLFSNSVDYFIL